MNEGAIFIDSYSEGCIDNQMSFGCYVAAEKNTKFTYKEFKEAVNICGHISFIIIYFCYGFVQTFATWGLFGKIFHQDNIITALGSVILGFLPVIGTGFGIFGAHSAWGWNLPNAILIFFVIPYFIVNGPLLMIGFYDMYKDWKRWQSEGLII